MELNKNTLAAEFQKELDDLVMKHTLELRNDNDYQIGFEKGMEAGIEIGATEYATKLQEVQIENVKLNESCNKMFKQNCKFNNELVDAKNILAEVFQKHESGLLPDRFVYDKIKLFLYGE